MDYSLKGNNGLEKFNRLIPGRKGIPRDIDSKFNPSGDFKQLEGIDAIVKGLLNLLTICSRTYLHDPEYGIGLYKYIFEPADEVTKNAIENAVNEASRRYEPRATCSSKVVFLLNKKGFRVDLSVSYKGERKKVSFTVDDSLLRTLSANS